MNEEQIKKFINLGFGRRFNDAHLSKFILPNEQCEIINSWFKKPKNFFIFCGNPGLGKTYLCACFAKEIIEKNIPIRYFNEKSLLEHLRKSIKDDVDYEYELKRLCDCPFIILDDLGSARQDKEWGKEIIFSFVDLRYASGLPTLITSNIWVDSMSEFYGPRFASRIRDKENIILEINWIDKRIEDF